MKNKLAKALIVCLIIIIIAAGGYYGYKKYSSSKNTKTTSQYITVTASKRNIQVNVQGTGTAYAATSKDVSPKNNGILKDLNVKVGDTVEAGEKLFKADSDEIEQNVVKLQNNLDKQKLTLDNAKNDKEKEADNLSISDAESQLNYAWEQEDNMTVKSPINGMITVVNNSSGDDVQSGKPVLSIIDPSSMKVKVAIDELDIAKIKQGQKAEITFGAIKDKTYEGKVESIAEVGTSTNNVTTYDVVVSISNPSNIKIGMNASVNILVDNKNNALTIPAEALIEKNGEKYVMTPNTNSSNGYGTQETSSSNSGQGSGRSGSRRSQGSNYSAGYMRSNYSNAGKLIKVKTGLENENYIEVTEGITEGEKLLIALPQNNSSNTTNNRNKFGSGFGSGFSGGMGGRTQSQSGSGSENEKN